MKRSTGRILTTHVGSLPRPKDLAALLMRKDAGESYDADEFEREVGAAVAAVVRRQAEIGLDIIDDGEMSKPSPRRWSRNMRRSRARDSFCSSIAPTLPWRITPAFRI